MKKFASIVLIMCCVLQFCSCFKTKKDETVKNTGKEYAAVPVEQNAASSFETSAALKFPEELPKNESAGELPENVSTEEEPIADEIVLSDEEKALPYNCEGFKIVNQRVYTLPEVGSLWHQEYIFSNIGLVFYRVDTLKKPVLVSYRYGEDEKEYFWCSRLSDFIKDMNSEISVQAFSEMLGIEIVKYDGCQAEDGYVNWYGLDYFVFEDNNTDYYVFDNNNLVYLFDPVSASRSSDEMLSEDCIVVFMHRPGMDPILSKKRNIWLDNTEIVFSFMKCPFVGCKLDKPKDQLAIYDGRRCYSYIDPESGWAYEVNDEILSGNCVSEKTYVTNVHIPAKDLFPGMGEKITYEEFCKKYANLPEVPGEEMNLEEYYKKYPNANFVIYWQANMLRIDDTVIGVCLDINANENRDITPDSIVRIEKNNYYLD